MASVKLSPEDAEALRHLAAESDSEEIISYLESCKEKQKGTETFRFWLPTIISAIALIVAILK